ncbi:hypothetical protein AAFF_G00396910 [Aldrovandia affinis]|uniref:Uncharacterized protein n=1 Tax=Aldrovandia affinis TaxID=143900 RepID=A0AAD7SDJ6_9TELE|nr:hypothetical protein AAFF_G00396910 [Aldrovandia affinis]
MQLMENTTEFQHGGQPLAVCHTFSVLPKLAAGGKLMYLDAACQRRLCHLSHLLHAGVHLLDSRSPTQGLPPRPPAGSLSYSTCQTK